MRNQLYLLVCHLLLVLEGYSQNHNGMLDQVGEWAEKYTVPITMDDGARLMTDVYLPVTGDSLTISLEAQGESFMLEVIPKGIQYIIYDSLNGGINDQPYELPVIFIRTPYNKNTEAIGYFLAFLGYAAIIQDNRGCYSSEGAYIPMYSDSWQKDPYHGATQHLLDINPRNSPANANFQEDGYKSLRFILDSLTREYRGETMKVSNGLVGMLGASALGNVQYQLASAHQIDPEGPGLKCLFPLVATNEHYRFTAVQNGVFRQELVTGWIRGQYNDLINDEPASADPTIFNSIHSPADFKLDTKAEAAETAIDFWMSYQPDDGPPGYYPNSALRADMDASIARIDAAGDGDPQGHFSRYRNLELPIYHLTGWWDIFIGGQIETYNQLMQNLSEAYGNKSLQKLVIGPWAHQTVTSRFTGDLVYPANVRDFLFDLPGVELDLEHLPVDELYDSEPMKWFRSHLNHNPWKNTGEPKIIIPENQHWQPITNDIKIRVPDRDYLLPYPAFLNYLSGHTGLDSIWFAISDKGAVTSSMINLPPLTKPLVSMEKINPPSPTDFRKIPNVRFYVVGPQSTGGTGDRAGGNYWFACDSFPFTTDITWHKLYLHEQQMLDSSEPSGDSGSEAYVHDPRNPVFTVGGANMITRTPRGDRRNQGQMDLSDPELAPLTMTREDVLSFESHALPDTLSIIGFPVANLFASSDPLESHSDSTSTDFFIRILDVYPGGGEYFVVEGAINARARKYAGQLIKGVEDPGIPFTNIASGRIYDYKFRMMPIAYTFGRGHKIKVLISSSNHPRYQSNPNLPVAPNTFFRWTPDDERPSRKALQTIYFSSEYPSHIELPVYRGQLNLPAGNELTDAVEDPNIRIFPNPASDLLFIEAGNTNMAFEIHNISGRKILTGILDSFQTINVESWDPGMYIIRFASPGSGIQHARKIIIR
jgi:predicted acyl esterase